MREKAKEIGIVIHVPEMPPYTKMFREGLTYIRKEEMIRALYRREAKLTWQKKHKSGQRQNNKSTKKKAPAPTGYRI